MKGIVAFLTFLFIIPVGHILTGMAIKFSVPGQLTVILIALSVAIVIMYATKYLSSETGETFFGLLAGVLLWASLFEIYSPLDPDIRCLTPKCVIREDYW